MAALLKQGREFLGICDDKYVIPVKVLFFNLFIYEFTFQCIQPVQIFIVEDLNFDSKFYTWLTFAFQLCQLVGGLTMGRVADAINSKTVIFIAMAGSALYFTILAVAKTKFLLILAQVPNLVLHASQATSGFVSDVSSPSDRTKALGRTEIPRTLGSIAGPFLGGFFSTWFGNTATCIVAAVLALSSGILVLLFVPSDQKHFQNADEKLPTLVGKIKKLPADIVELVRVLGRPPVAVLTNFGFGVSVAFGLWSALFGFLVYDHFHLSKVAAAAVFSGRGLCEALAAIVIAPVLARYFLDKRVAITAALLMVPCFIVWGYAETSLALTLIFSMILMICSGTFSVTATSALTKSVPLSCTASAVAVYHACRASGSMAASPLAGALEGENNDIRLVGWVAAICCTVSVSLFWVLDNAVSTYVVSGGGGGPTELTAVTEEGNGSNMHNDSSDILLSAEEMGIPEKQEEGAEYRKMQDL